MSIDELKQRFKLFALDVVNLVDEIPTKISGQVIARQIMKSGTSASANYRASCRAKSKPDFISKMGIVEEELD